MNVKEIVSIHVVYGYVVSITDDVEYLHHIKTDPHMKEIVPIYVVYWYIMSITLLGDEINTNAIVSIHVIYEYIMSITLLGRGNEREGNCFNT